MIPWKLSGTERLGNLPQATKWANGRVKNRTQLPRLLFLCSEWKTTLPLTLPLQPSRYTEVLWFQSSKEGSIRRTIEGVHNLCHSQGSGDHYAKADGAGRGAEAIQRRSRNGARRPLLQILQCSVLQWGGSITGTDGYFSQQLHPTSVPSCASSQHLLRLGIDMGI